MRKATPFSAQSGQIGLIVLLGMVIVATIGISVATRSTQDIRSTRQDQESSQTFSAAESALEQILSMPSEEVFQFSGESLTQEFTEFSGNVAADVNIEKQFSFDDFVREGEVIEIDVSNVTQDRPLVLQWSESSDCSQTPSSLVVSVNNSLGPDLVRHYAFGPCDNGDNFDLLDTSQAQYRGTELAVRNVVTLQDGDTLVRIRPVYADSRIFIETDGSWQLTAQQFRITSTGRNQAEGGRETRAIQLNRTLPFAPNVLDFAIVSGQSINKEL